MESNVPEAPAAWFEALWRRYYRRLWVFVRTYAGVSTEEAEDLVQEILWKVYNARSRFNHGRAASPWVYRIARNHCVDRLRRRELPVASGVDPDTLGGPAAGYEDTRAAVRAFMDAAAPRDRQILYLRFDQRMGVAGVARALDMPVGTVKYRLHELRAALKARMEE